MQGFLSPRLPLSVALAGLPGNSVREQVEAAAALGVRAVQLHGSARDLRPRELSRSARRDVAGLLRRHDLICSGIDLWIPREHFLSSQHQELAIDATCAALEFASELSELTDGQAVVSLMLPRGEAGDGLCRQLGEMAGERRARIADHSWPPDASLDSDTRQVQPIGLGLDPASAFQAGADPSDPVRAASRYGPALASARLTDCSDEGRTVPGDGRLDVLAYVVALSTAGYPGSLVVDGRGLRRPLESIRGIVARYGERAD